MSSGRTGVAATFGRWWPGVLGAVLYPLAYLAASGVATWLRDVYVELYPTHLAISVVALGVLGALTFAGWRRGLRLFPLLAWGGLAPWTWQYAGQTTGVASLTFLFVGLLLVIGVVEWGVRSPGAVAELLASREGRIAVGAGIAHLAVGVSLQWVASDGIGVASIGLAGWVLLALSALAVAGMGVLPLLLWVRWRLVTPLLWVVFQLSLALVWLVLSGEIPDMHTTAGVTLFLYQGYLANWGLPSVILLVLAGVEYGARGVWRRVVVSR